MSEGSIDPPEERSKPVLNPKEQRGKEPPNRTDKYFGDPVGEFKSPDQLGIPPDHPANAAFVYQVDRSDEQELRMGIERDVLSDNKNYQRTRSEFRRLQGVLTGKSYDLFGSIDIRELNPPLVDYTRLVVEMVINGYNASSGIPPEDRKEVMTRVILGKLTEREKI